MVTRILKATASARSALDYNEGKVSQGTAAVVAAVGLRDDSPYTIYRSFEEREANPAISARARKLGFHMTVSPGPGDSIDEAGVVAYVAEVMVGLGYGEQPYVIYRHNDIEREHYHVVSVNAAANGKIIDSRYCGVRLLALQREMSGRYGFTVGLAEAGQRQDFPPAGRITAGAADLLARMSVNVDAALRYRSADGVQLRAVLFTYGLELKRTLRDGREIVSLRAVDESGRALSRTVGLKRATGMDCEDFEEKVRSAIAAGRRNGRRGRIPEAVRKAFAASSDLDEMASRLEARGIAMVALSPSGKMSSRRKEAEDLFFVDMQGRDVAPLAATGIPLGALLAMERGKRRKKDEECLRREAERSAAKGKTGKH